MTREKYTKTIALWLLVFSTMFSGSLLAEQSKPLLNKGLISIGGGLSANSVAGPSGDQSGFQLFAGYDLKQVELMDDVASAVEVGYMDYGFNRYSGGLWANYLARGRIDDQFGWLGRLGLDFGDDSGMMFGAGLYYRVNVRMDVRGEYVIRDNVDSLQFNVNYHL